MLLLKTALSTRIFSSCTILIHFLSGIVSQAYILLPRPCCLNYTKRERFAHHWICAEGRIIIDIWLVALRILAVRAVTVKLALYLHIQIRVLRGLAGILKPLTFATALIKFFNCYSIA
ncbi:hypothetical protein SLEP1_g30672 [Rubroshorea leprosula]|uniref:Secreted protein n=1 Tax=Rubroshorea leprosula TaxID=152421 RepID=A0AAV5K920_9ROSI|nr:hypothetical protein SLEP1_g30672 [Rubroshorea leprosula]